MPVLLLCCALALLLAALAGCASLSAAAPDSVSLVLEHTSHITQHAPIASHPTNYGYDDIALLARWQSGPIWLEVSDGYTCMSGWQSLPGPREVFRAEAGVTLWRRP